jgi:beta-N-acetylhexosaminidase
MSEDCLMRRTLVTALSLALPVVLLGACTSNASPDPSSSSSTASPTPTASSARTSSVHSSSGRASATSSATPDASTVKPAPSPAQLALNKMSEAKRVGQLLMVDCPSAGVASATVTAIQKYHVGSVILDGNSQLGVTRTRAIAARLQGYAPKAVGLFISTDQEGGLVQRMRGPGFSSIPSAIQQGTSAPSSLRAEAKTWGRQLRTAGINVDLAPVLDTVPADGRSNPPIGDLDREYGHTPSVVRSHGTAVARGLADAGVDATVKHFPGLGRVTGNTDTTSGVTDSVTTRHDAYLAPFAAAITGHVPFVMMSTAIYSRIDPNSPAAFSSTIVTGMLRDDLGFTGVVISDDVGGARQVSGYSVGQRAVDFVRAGGDIVLTVNANQAAAMTAALLARAKSSPSFKKKIDAAALRVLQAKHARGLLN